MVSVCGHLGKYTKPKQTTMLWALVTLIFDKQTCSGQWCSDEKSISSLISQRIWLGIWCHNKNQISSLWTTKKAYQNTHPPLWKSQSLLKSQSKCVKKNLSSSSLHHENPAPWAPPASVSDRICESRGAALSSSPGIWPMDPHGLPGSKNGMEGTYGGGHAWHRDLGHSKWRWFMWFENPFSFKIIQCHSKLVAILFQIESGTRRNVKHLTEHAEVIVRPS